MLPGPRCIKLGLNYKVFFQNVFWHEWDPYESYGRHSTVILHGIAARIQWDYSWDLIKIYTNMCFGIFYYSYVYVNPQNHVMKILCNMDCPAPGI